jgi:ectoine hydroxylase-related dioxygenase (phytanoyl-CoA dioxygenase family)
MSMQPRASKTSTLPQKEIEDFKNLGYAIVRGLFDARETQEIRGWTDELIALPEAPGKYMKYFEQSLAQPGKRILSRIENFVPYHTGFSHLVMGPKMLAAVSELLAEPAVLFKDKINLKLPGGDGFKAHQDMQAGWDTYAPFYITAMVAIDRSTAENGSLEMVAGQHDKGLLGRMWEPLTEAETAGMQFVPIYADPGDAVFFDSFAPHRSGPNSSSKPRRVLYITYNRLSDGDHREQYYADKRKSYPPDCERVAGKTYEYKV